VNPNHITSEIIGAAVKVHRKLGPGLLESCYEGCVEYELNMARLQVRGRKLCRWFTRRSSSIAASVRTWL
jgi:GxxExxY protein